MNKETKLQILELLQETREHLDVDEVPEYDDVDFMPIASDRHTHTEAVLAIASDVARACEERTAESAELVAPELTAD